MVRDPDLETCFSSSSASSRVSFVVFFRQQKFFRLSRELHGNTTFITGKDYLVTELSQPTVETE